MVYYSGMILWTDFLALSLVTAVVILLPQLRQLDLKAPKFLQMFVRLLPYLLAFLWVSSVLLWRNQ